MFNLTYEFKLKPSKNQIEIFGEWLETHRRVYNHALSERKDWYKSRSCQIKACSLHSCYIIPAEAPRPTFASQCKSLTAARKNNEYLGKVNAQSLQQTLRRLEKAFVSMWEQNHGFPRFKKVGQMQSFSFPQLGKNPLQNGYIKLPVIGMILLRQSREIPDGGVLKQARVVKRVSGWYVMLTVQWDVNPPQPMPHGEGIGIDVGLTSMVATSSGLLIKRPRFFVDAERKLKLLRQKAVWIFLPLYCRATTC
ncbi:MAG: transposase [Rivularia sp. (in: cyanobacteria)]